MRANIERTVRALTHASKMIGTLSTIPHSGRQADILMSALVQAHENVSSFVYPPEVLKHAAPSMCYWTEPSITYLLSMVLFTMFTQRAPWEHLLEATASTNCTRITKQDHPRDRFQIAFAASWVCAPRWIFCTQRKRTGAYKHPRPWFHEKDGQHIPLNIVMVLQQCWRTDPSERPPLSVVGDIIRKELFDVFRSCAVFVSSTGFVSLHALLKWSRRCYAVSHVEFQVGNESGCRGCPCCGASLLAWRLCAALERVERRLDTGADVEVLTAWHHFDGLFDIFVAAMPYLTKEWLPGFIALDNRLTEIETRVAVCKATAQRPLTSRASQTDRWVSLFADPHKDDFVQRTPLSSTQHR
jgi:hypothetical protein